MSDFSEDMRAHTAAPGKGWRRYAMYLALWAGAGSMAAIGRYL
jgi:solute carrier family 39 (zinc transporter), member 1/2/3